MSAQSSQKVFSQNFVTSRAARSIVVSLCLSLLSAIPATAQQLDFTQIPSQFTLDYETATRLRPQLMAQSAAAGARYRTGQLVFDRLLANIEASSHRLSWQLRIIPDSQLNAFSSPDGTIFVENGLADLAGQSTGLWAALLSHEIAHVLRRDWARRYLYERTLESGRAVPITLGDPGFPDATWSSSEKASADFGRFCRQMEIEADRAGLMLMARAGYHPDFVPALHHLLHAYASGPANSSIYAMHPCWDERDRELSRAYVEASINFEHRWPEWYASPGGNPPVVVFADQPTVKKTAANAWQIHIPIRCQNLAGAVEVVLRADSGRRQPTPERVANLAEDENELRQLTGCTSPKASVTFTLDSDGTHSHNPRWTNIYVLDSWGVVLARAHLPKLPR